MLSLPNPILIVVCTVKDEMQHILSLLRHLGELEGRKEYLQNLLLRLYTRASKILNHQFLHLDPKNLLLFIPIFVNSILISYFINLTLSFLGFWTTEIWPIRFIYVMLLSFIAGNYFPLDILPQSLYNFIMLTPFPYMFYLPSKLLISNIAIQQYNNSFIMSYLWLIGSYLITRLTWIKGIKSFSFWGR